MWPDDKGKTSTGAKIGIGCVGLIGLFVILVIVSSVGSEKSAAPTHMDAVLMSQHFVEERLKAPSTAKFQDLSDAKVTETGANTYRVVLARCSGLTTPAN